MQLKIALCDDSEEDRRYIEKLVRNWAESSGESVGIQSFPSAEAFLFHYEEEKDFAILLLDIEMGQIDGVSLAKKIRRENPAVQIVFISGYSDYIAEGYEVEALHYLLKPVRAEKLSEVLERAALKFRTNERMIALEYAGEVNLVPLRAIQYVEVYRNYSTVHTKNGSYTVKKPLGELEQELADERFYRVSRSLLLNLTEVSRVSHDQIMLRDGTRLDLPGGKYDELNRELIKRL